uniref:breast carcinoma-amplified sequence 1 isoform X1 n=1 Tax=Jaculus jaculus TaxID=51337 RepID=UPI001E1AF8CD|nr:breast carcinoma-amplified sequence 1 isoform X1 [Jaculus jaculus]
MGNQMSVPQRNEDQENEPEAGTYKVTSDGECGQNGMPVIVSTHVVQHYDEVDLGISIPEEKAATASPEAMETSAGGKSLGKKAKPEAPAVKSRFFLTLSRPVPGRPGDQGTDSWAAPGRLDVSPSAEPANKDPSERAALPDADAPGPAPDKTPARTPGKDQVLSATWPPAPLPPESGAAAPSRSKDSSFLDKFFKLDRGEGKATGDSEGASADAPSGQSRGVPGAEDTVDSEGREDIETLSSLVPGDSEKLGLSKEGAQETDLTEKNNPIMSFFKTLVSPNKAETKKASEAGASKADSVCDGPAGQKMAEVPTKGKKKHVDSPRIGLAFRKMFRRKGAENSPTTSANLQTDKGNVIPQETQGASKSPKGCSPPGHVPLVTAGDSAKDSGKEKSGPTSLPLGKLFWKKSVKEDSVSTGAEENAVCDSPVKTVQGEEVESTLETVDLSEDAPPEPTDAKPKEDGKARRTPLMALLRQMSVKGNGGISHSEELNGKDSSDQTSNSPEKTATPPEPEPRGTAQKSKEGSSKDKRSVADSSKQKSSKQEARESAQGAPPPTGEANSLQNGDKSLKRPEKRQPLGAFLKGLGPKRMADAQVQTDPVSIGPVGKSK